MNKQKDVCIHEQASTAVLELWNSYKLHENRVIVGGYSTLLA